MNNEIPKEETNIILLLQRINVNLEKIIIQLSKIRGNTNRYE